MWIINVRIECDCVYWIDWTFHFGICDNIYFWSMVLPVSWKYLMEETVANDGSLMAIIGSVCLELSAATDKRHRLKSYPHSVQKVILVFFSFHWIWEQKTHQHASVNTIPGKMLQLNKWLHVSWLKLFQAEVRRHRSIPP